jgi:hypothetical protein
LCTRHFVFYDSARCCVAEKLLDIEKKVEAYRVESIFMHPKKADIVQLASFMGGQISFSSLEL